MILESRLNPLPGSWDVPYILGFSVSHVPLIIALLCLRPISWTPALTSTMSSTRTDGIKVCVLCPSMGVKVGHEL